MRNQILAVVALTWFAACVALLVFGWILGAYS